MCAAVWSSSTLGARDPGFSFLQPTPTHLTALAAPAARAKTTSGTQGNLGSISAVSRVQSSIPPEKSSFERMGGGSFSKQRLIIEPIRDKRGQLRVILISLKGRKLLSSLQARWVLLWAKSVSCAGQICSYCRYILEILVPVYSAPILAAFGLSVSPSHGDL